MALSSVFQHLERCLQAILIRVLQSHFLSFVDFPSGKFHCEWIALCRVLFIILMIHSYIVSQILGGYLACAGVYFPFRYVFLQIEDVMRQRGVLEELQFTTQGPSGVFAFYVPLGQTIWGAWLSEFLAVSHSNTISCYADSSNFVEPYGIHDILGCYGP